MVEIFNLTMSKRRKRGMKIQNAQSIVYIIPKLKEFKEISCQRGDTLVATVDTDIFTLDQIPQILEALGKQFPDNNVICMPKGIELEGVRENE